MAIHDHKIQGNQVSNKLFSEYKEKRLVDRKLGFYHKKGDFPFLIYNQNGEQLQGHFY